MDEMEDSCRKLLGDLFSLLTSLPQSSLSQSLTPAEFDALQDLLDRASDQLGDDYLDEQQSFSTAAATPAISAYDNYDDDYDDDDGGGDSGDLEQYQPQEDESEHQRAQRGGHAYEGCDMDAENWYEEVGGGAGEEDFYDTLSDGEENFARATKKSTSSNQPPSGSGSGSTLPPPPAETTNMSYTCLQRRAEKSGPLFRKNWMSSLRLKALLFDCKLFLYRQKDKDTPELTVQLLDAEVKKDPKKDTKFSITTASHKNTTHEFKALTAADCEEWVAVLEEATRGFKTNYGVVPGDYEPMEEEDEAGGVSTLPEYEEVDSDSDKPMGVYDDYEDDANDANMSLPSRGSSSQEASESHYAEPTSNQPVDPQRRLTLSDLQDEDDDWPEPYVEAEEDVASPTSTTSSIPPPLPFRSKSPPVLPPKKSPITNPKVASHTAGSPPPPDLPPKVIQAPSLLRQSIGAISSTSSYSSLKEMDQTSGGGGSLRSENGSSEDSAKNPPPSFPPPPPPSPPPPPPVTEGPASSSPSFPPPPSEQDMAVPPSMREKFVRRSSSVLSTTSALSMASDLGPGFADQLQQRIAQSQSRRLREKIEESSTVVKDRSPERKVLSEFEKIMQKRREAKEAKAKAEAEAKNTVEAKEGLKPTDKTTKEAESTGEKTLAPWKKKSTPDKSCNIFSKANGSTPHSQSEGLDKGKEAAVGQQDKPTPGDQDVPTLNPASVKLWQNTANKLNPREGKAITANPAQFKVGPGQGTKPALPVTKPQQASAAKAQGASTVPGQSGQSRTTRPEHLKPTAPGKKPPPPVSKKPNFGQGSQPQRPAWAQKQLRPTATSLATKPTSNARQSKPIAEATRTKGAQPMQSWIKQQKDNSSDEDTDAGEWSD